VPGVCFIQRPARQESLPLEIVPVRRLSMCIVSGGYLVWKGDLWLRWCLGVLGSGAWPADFVRRLMAANRLLGILRLFFRLSAYSGYAPLTPRASTPAPSPPVPDPLLLAISSASGLELLPRYVTRGAVDARILPESPCRRQTPLRLLALTNELSPVRVSSVLGTFQMQAALVER